MSEDRTNTCRVVAHELSKRYRNGTLGLTSGTFTADSGMFLAVIGQNGAGKSTLLNIVGGVIGRTAGTLEVSPARTQPNWSPQRTLVDWSLTVRQNVELGARLAWRGAKSGSRVDEVLSLLDLEKVAGKEAENLSGGQLQRVQIARALVGRSPLYVMDEPAAGLDPIAADLVMAFLKDKAVQGAVVLVSSHDLDAVERSATDVLMVRDGVAADAVGVQAFVARAAGGRQTVRISLARPVQPMQTLLHGPAQPDWTATASDDGLDLTVEVPAAATVVDVLTRLSPDLQVRDASIQRQSLRDVYIGVHEDQTSKEATSV